MADLPIPATPPEDVRRIADEVLSRGEFAEAQPTWWQRLLLEVYEAIGKVIEALGGGGRGSIIATVTIVVVALAMLYLVVRYATTLRADPRSAAVTDTSLGRSAGEWAAEAQAHEAAGAWRDAVRCRYRALLAELAAAGLVDEVAGRTSGEYLAAVGEDVPGAAEPFTRATRTFETAWYGHGTTAAEDVTVFRAAARDTLAAAGVRRPAAAVR